jgi:hypothetical protein
MGAIARLEIKKGELKGSALIEPGDRPGPVILEVGNFSAQLRQIDFDAFRDPSTSADVAGNLEAETARFGDIHVRDVRSQLRVQPKQLTFKNFKAKTYRGKASGDFTFSFKQASPQFNTDLQVSGIGVNYLLAEFQTGPPAMRGMMEGNVKLSGTIENTANPLAGTIGGGHFTIRSGEFPMLRGNKKIAAMKRFRNPGAAARPISEFSSFAGDMELKNHRIYNKNLALDFYGIDLTGSGDLNEVSGSMNYRGVATIQKKQGFFTNVVAKVFKGADEKQGRLTFPIRVTGTLTNPEFSVAH